MRQRLMGALVLAVVVAGTVGTLQTLRTRAAIDCTPYEMCRTMEWWDPMFFAFECWRPVCSSPY